MSTPSSPVGWLCVSAVAIALALASALTPLEVDADATVDGQFAELGIRSAGATTVLPVAGRGGVPVDATAVTLNVTSTGSVAPGFVTVYPCGASRPNTSNVNFGAGATIANAVTSQVGVDGAVCIYNEASTHLIVDVNGYFPPAAGYGSVVPDRLLDTRGASPAASAEGLVLTLVNQLRASRGLESVVPDRTMGTFARNWSSTMSQSGFRHSGGPYAENIGWVGGATSPEVAARRVYTAFLESPPHLANMVNPVWTSVGIGLHRDGTDWYLTVEFR